MRLLFASLQAPIYKGAPPLLLFLRKRQFTPPKGVLLRRTDFRLLRKRLARLGTPIMFHTVENFFHLEEIDKKVSVAGKQLGSQAELTRTRARNFVVVRPNRHVESTRVQFV